MVKRKEVSLKVIVLGDSGVGKTSLLKRYIKQRFVNDCNATLGTDFSIKQIIIDDYVVNLQIWDTSGKECFRSLAISFSQNVDGCILVFDVTSTATFEHLNSWLKEFLEQTEPDHPEQFPFVALGNKTDMDSRSVSVDEAKQWCESKYCIPYFEVSAKNGANINSAFENMVKNALAQRKNAELPGSSSETQPGTSLNDREKPQRKRVFNTLLRSLSFKNDKVLKN